MCFPPFFNSRNILFLLFFLFTTITISIMYLTNYGLHIILYQHLTFLIFTFVAWVINLSIFKQFNSTTCTRHGASSRLSRNPKIRLWWLMTATSKCKTRAFSNKIDWLSIVSKGWHEALLPLRHYLVDWYIIYDASYSKLLLVP